MAITTERLVAVLEMRLDKYEKALSKAVSSTDSGFTKIETRGQTLAAKLDAALGTVGSQFSDSRKADIAAYGSELDKLRSKYDPLFAASKRYETSLDELNRALSVGAITAGVHEAALERLNADYAALSGAATRASSSAVTGLGNVNTTSRALESQTGNLAAQFNDIGVQLAGGQSPFLIALQQGSQINQVLGPAGAVGAVGALSGAFMSLLSPVSLATIALITVGGTAIQYFTQLLSDGEASEETLKEQAALIQQVAAEWGAAVPALKEYADEVQRLADIQEIISAADAAVSQKWAPVREEVSGLNVEMADLSSLLRDLGATENISTLNTEFQELSDKIADGTATAEDAEQVQAALAATFSQTQEPAVAALIERFNQLAVAIANVSGSAAVISEQAALAAGLEKSVLPTLGGVGPVLSTNGQFVNQSGLIQADAERTQSQTQIAAAKEAVRAARSSGSGGKGRGGRDSAAAKADREREAVTKLIETLQFEQSMIGATDLEREQANALRRAGSTATEEQKAQITSLIAAIHAEEEALRASEDAMQALNELGRDVLGGFVNDLRQGTSAADALANALGRLADRLLDGALDSLFSGSSGGGGGGLGGLLGSIFGGFRAGGGSVSGGKAYVVGEKGPELFAPGRSGTVIPNGAFGGGKQQSTHVTVGISADGNGNIAPFVESVVTKQGGAMMQAGLSQYDKSLPSKLPSMTARGRARAG
ncbi:MAG: phage tail length tape measure family protein [Aurantimonas endophytica]|uniref:phage tail length tape measure family protein n=1 Tax=Aurantimonas endophytica TaxID=1522175 RepID=UPI003001923F